MGVVRISGPLAGPILRRIFHASPHPTRQPRRLLAGQVREPGGEVLDQSLAVFMPGPRSFTGEDVAEIHCHGSPALIREIVKLTCSLGARTARAGEFIHRAFDNGKIDLQRVEAVLALTEARSPLDVRAAARSLGTELSDMIAGLRSALAEQVALLNAIIEFPDEPEVAATRPNLEGLVRTVEGIRARLRRVATQGWRIVVAGRTNVGKSSLVNALAHQRVSIVTDQAGTTRDAVGVDVELEGAIVRLIDTAGVGGGEGSEADRMAQQVSREQIENADLLLWVGDERGGTLDRPPDITDRVLVVQNKADLLDRERRERLEEQLASCGRILVSAKSGYGLSRLESEIKRVMRDEFGPDDGIAASDRVVFGLERVCDALREAVRNLDALPELALSDLATAGEEVDALLGKRQDQDVLAGIFDRFCIGK